MNHLFFFIKSYNFYGANFTRFLETADFGVDSETHKLILNYCNSSSLMLFFIKQYCSIPYGILRARYSQTN